MAQTLAPPCAPDFSTGCFRYPLLSNRPARPRACRAPVTGIDSQEMSHPAAIPERLSDCQLCGGTGWRTLPPDADHKSSRVTRCQCHLQNRAERLLALARIPVKYQKATLQNYEIVHNGSHHQALTRAMFVAEQFIEKYPAEKRGLLITGSVGVGKTHLAIGIIKHLILNKGIDCLFIDYRSFLKEMRDTYSPIVMTTEMSLLKPILESEIVVLDDIGAEKVSDWVEETVGFVLNERYINEKTTIITSNLVGSPPTDAKPWEPVDNFSKAKRAMREETLGDRLGLRMWSRVSEMCTPLDIQGPDRRTKK